MPVKKPYRVRRTVDQSMRYFEASYLTKHLLHDRDDEDERERRAVKSSAAATARSPDYRNNASVRSSRFDFDSAQRFDSNEVDDVTNIKR